MLNVSESCFGLITEVFLDQRLRRGDSAQGLRVWLAPTRNAEIGLILSEELESNGCEAKRYSDAIQSEQSVEWRAKGIRKRTSLEKGARCDRIMAT